jgi:4-amino-4-deoxychorismate lyase
MCHLFETIKIENAVICNPEWHLRRIAESLEKVFGDNQPTVTTGNDINHERSPLTLFEELEHLCLPKELHKCRVVYNAGIVDIQITPYYRITLNRFRLVECNTISYPFKFTDRQKLEQLFTLRGKADEIIIVKNGCITDASVANLVFFDGKSYFTPDTPLLAGTHRARLLAEEKIFQRSISVNDLHRYESFKPINAMSEEGFQNMIPVENIIV